MSKDKPFKLPPHINAAIHARIMARLERMSAEEIFQTSVNAGIHRPDGSLAEPYAQASDDAPTVR